MKLFRALLSLACIGFSIYYVNQAFNEIKVPGHEYVALLDMLFAIWLWPKSSDSASS